MLALLIWMKKILKWILCMLLVVFTLLQFTNPARTNPPVVQDLMVTNVPPPHVATLLLAACYDCHSNETKWPWYSRIAPASWLVVKDVVDGREHLNLSDWPADNPTRAAKRLDRMSEEIDYHQMPPKKYTLLHADARLTDTDCKELITWLDAEAERLRASTK
ncbi:MAG: heme-binding domain-containing protein [Limisphaerales bacterium]